MDFCIIMAPFASLLLIVLLDVGIIKADFRLSTTDIGFTDDLRTAGQLMLQSNFRFSFFNPDSSGNSQFK